MQKAKPLEPGCKAMVLPGGEIKEDQLMGQIVDVIRDHGGTFYPPDGSTALLRAWKFKLDDEDYVCSIDLLMRIDDPDEEESIFNAVDLRESIDG